jgi:hypothetical protein
MALSSVRYDVRGGRNVEEHQNSERETPNWQQGCFAGRSVRQLLTEGVRRKELVD